MTKTFVIMEVAGTHGGDLKKAAILVGLAADIGADAVKFQWLSSPERLVERRRAPEYLEAYRTIAFPREWFAVLDDWCRRARVEFMCTAYLPEDVAVVAQYVQRFKVSSFESQDAHFVGLHAEWPEKPLILSAGMGSDVSESVRFYHQLAERAWYRARGDLAYHPWEKIRVLHCVSAYPCPDNQAALARIRQEDCRWNFAGYSDHTRHPWAGALAVAAGARVVEFHARLYDTGPENADFVVSRTPAEAREYVANIRAAEALLGDGGRGAMPAEEPMLRYRVGVK